MNTLAPTAQSLRAGGEAADVAAGKVHAAYRADIDGLRAVAVLSVVLFHYFPSVLPGGFVGVDVFFVISGYLISGIILGELRNGRFSFAGFYARRIRRIFPALGLVLVAVLAFGWTALLAAEYVRLGAHAMAGAAFVSNLLLWSESGYFAPAALAQPLLHLWSLGIEEQFYLIWPVILCVSWWIRSKLLAVIALLAVLSFGVSLAASYGDPVAAFYSPVTRWWELMIGALLAAGELQRARAPDDRARLLASPHVALACSVAGASLLLGGAVLAREQNFPGWQALLPAAGAALMIGAGPQSAINRAVLARAPLVGIGLVSYPLYLWHWPLLSFARIVHGEPGAGLRATLLVLSVVLAVLTWRLLERPVKQARRRGGVTALLVALLAAVGVAGFALAATDGLPQRPVVRDNIDLQRWKGYRALPFSVECPFIAPAQKNLFRCQVDPRAPPSLALLGDSKAGALYPGLFRTSRPGGRWLFLGSPQAGPLVPVISDNPIYGHINQTAIATALRTIEQTGSVETVVIATAARALFQLPTDASIAGLPASTNGAIALEALDATVSRLLAAGKRVVLLVDNPTLPHMEDCIARKTGSAFFNRLLQAAPNPDCRIPLARHLEFSAPYRRLLDTLVQRHPAGVSLFDPLALLCDQGICTPTREGQFLYGVTDHLSDYASGLVGEALNAHLQPAPSNRPVPGPPGRTTGPARTSDAARAAPVPARHAQGGRGRPLAGSPRPPAANAATACT